MFSRILFWVYVLYCFEVGLFLIVFPWMSLWDDNPLLSYVTSIRPLLLSNYFRGAVSGMGMANIVLGCWEVFHSQRADKEPRLGAANSVRDI